MPGFRIRALSLRSRAGPVSESEFFSFRICVFSFRIQVFTLSFRILVSDSALSSFRSVLPRPSSFPIRFFQFPVPHANLSRQASREVQSPAQARCPQRHVPAAGSTRPLHTTFQCPKRQALLSMFVNWLPLMMLLHRPSVIQKTCSE